MSFTETEQAPVAQSSSHAHPATQLEPITSLSHVNPIDQYDQIRPANSELQLGETWYLEPRIHWRCLDLNDSHFLTFSCLPRHENSWDIPSFYFPQCPLHVGWFLLILHLMYVITYIYFVFILTIVPVCRRSPCWQIRARIATLRAWVMFFHVLK